MSNWTTKHPTQPGFYWIVQRTDLPRVVEVLPDGKRGVEQVVYWPGMDDGQHFDDLDQPKWLGPLAVDGPPGVTVLDEPPDPVAPHPDWHLEGPEDHDGGVTLYYRDQPILDVDLDSPRSYTVRVLSRSGRVKVWVKGRVAG